MVLPMARAPKDPTQPKIPRLAKTQYPTGRTVPEAARREVYASFRQHADEVREMLIGFVRDEELDPSHRIMAGKEILNRGLGTAPSVEIVEKTLKVDLSFSDDKIKQMSSAELQVAIDVMQRLLIDPQADDAEVIEHDPR